MAPALRQRPRARSRVVDPHFLQIDQGGRPLSDLISEVRHGSRNRDIILHRKGRPGNLSASSISRQFVRHPESTWTPQPASPCHRMSIRTRKRGRRGNLDAARFDGLPRPALRQEWFGQAEIVPAEYPHSRPDTIARPELSRVVDLNPSFVGRDPVAGY
jgi:hypothetical protein